MDSKTLALIATIALVAGSFMTTGNNSSDNFESFKVKYGKAYESESEHSYRLGVYTANMAEIDAHNANTEATYTRGENQFADLTNAEFRSIYLMTVAPKKSTQTPVSGEPMIGDVNWVTKGAVQAVKNQGQCGSCWAFSTVAVTESDKFIKTGTLGDFSEQQLVSCDTANSGCGGGWPHSALDYFASTGICEESSYPYTSGGGSVAACQISSCTKDSFTIGGHNSISATVSAVKAANEVQPVSICVDASSWSSYTGGIFNDCTTSIDHAVLLAGYSGNSYWLVKNSWGASWGEQGYIRLTGGADTCGILDYAVVPS